MWQSVSRLVGSAPEWRTPKWIWWLEEVLSVVEAFSVSLGAGSVCTWAWVLG